jgi:hypothetical protein
LRVRLLLKNRMAQEFKPGQIFPQSESTRLPAIRRMPTCRTRSSSSEPDTSYCRRRKAISFRLTHAAKHVSKAEHLPEPEVASM